MAYIGNFVQPGPPGRSFDLPGMTGQEEGWWK